MASDVRCVCPCHTHSGTYPPPCNVCGHDTREGRWVGGYRGWWEPNGDPRDEQIARLMALLAERDDALARLAAAEAALAPCTLAREYRDGVTCREERDDKGVCFNHRVVRGLRVHAVTADRLELENRALRRQVRATYGIIHEGLHGGKAADPEHQEMCERPACRNARAALAVSREQAGEGA